MTLSHPLFPQLPPSVTTEVKDIKPILHSEETALQKTVSIEEPIALTQHSLFDRQVTDDQPFTPSAFLRGFFEGVINLTVSDAATFVCQYIANLTQEPISTVERNLSAAYFQDREAFFIHCIQFFESTKILPDDDETFDQKVTKAYTAYQSCSSRMIEVDTVQLKFFMTDLTAIPPEIGRLTNLQKLNLWCHYLTFLPDSITALTNLVTLILKINNFAHFPIQILSLQNLTSLNFSRNTMTTLPDHFGDLRALTSLDLSENKLVGLPDSFCQLTNLTKLILNENHIETLPSEFGNLLNLAELVLYKNDLRLIPDSFPQLINLTYLDISFNKLILLPDDMHQLHALKSLMLNGNHLMDFNPRILKLPLETFYLYSNGNNDQLKIAIQLYQRFGSVFIEGYSQPPEPLDDIKDSVYCELLD